FTFLKESPAQINIIPGDARLKLVQAPDKHYGLIVVDAFSSDAIPVHLLTREALEGVYGRKLTDDGVLAFHISNRFLDLRPVLGDLTAALGWVARVRVDLEKETMDKAPSTWVLLARKEAHLGKLAADSGWKPLAGRSGAAVWTDDFSNVFRVIQW